MKRGIFLIPIAIALFIVAHTTRASAEFAVCNAGTHGTITLAYAATWHDGQGNSYGQSQGWWQIPQTECRIIITTVDVSAYTMYIYGFANSDPAHQYWGGTTNFCLDPNDKFLYHGDAMDVPCSAGKSYGMRLMDTGGATPYTYYLRD